MRLNNCLQINFGLIFTYCDSHLVKKPLITRQIDHKALPRNLNFVFFPSRIVNG